MRNGLGKLGQLYLNMQTQSVCSRFEASGVVNFRLGLVIAPSLHGASGLWLLCSW